MCKGRCYAYEELKRQLQDQCTTYLKLHPNKEIGKGRYTDKGEPVPNREISEYLRGGVISTMAVFEAFLSSIMAEAFDRIIYEHKPDPTCSGLNGCSHKCKVGRLKNLESLRESTVCTRTFKLALQCDAKLPLVAQRAQEVVFGQKNLEELLVGHRDSLVDGTPLLHSFDEAFSKLLDPREEKKGNDKQVIISDFIFSVTGQQHEPINYLYLLDDEFHSKIAISDKETLCAILRLWYGIRCISAHGVAHKTIKRRDGALKDFPKCSKCNKEGDKTAMLKDAGDLCKHLDEMLDEPDLETILKDNYSKYPDNYKNFLKVKRFPKPSIIKNISVKEQNAQAKKKAIELAERHWSNPTDEEKGEYPPAFGFYHMYRTYFFISHLQRDMYITYRLLVRINQFVLLLAFRIKLAVAKWLSECEDSEVMPELKELWGYTDDTDRLEESIKKLEADHEERINKIKEESAATN